MVLVDFGLVVSVSVVSSQSSALPCAAKEEETIKKRIEDLKHEQESKTEARIALDSWSRARTRRKRATTFVFFV